jgi:hypothetical protein
MILTARRNVEHLGLRGAPMWADVPSTVALPRSRSMFSFVARLSLQDLES